MFSLRSVVESFGVRDGSICKPASLTSSLFDINRVCRSSYIQTPAYYAVAMPVSLSSAFLLKWEVVGLWVGVALALVIVAGLQIIVVYMTKWDKVVEDAYIRVVDVE